MLRLQQGILLSCISSQATPIPTPGKEVPTHLYVLSPSSRMYSISPFASGPILSTSRTFR